MDLTELSVERIRTMREGVRERVAALTRFYIALLAVAGTIAGTAAIAVSAGQLAEAPAVAIGGGTTAVALVGGRGVLKARAAWETAVAESVGAIEELMLREGETDVDDEEETPP